MLAFVEGKGGGRGEQSGGERSMSGMGRGEGWQRGGGGGG